METLIVKLLFPAILAFCIGILITPLVTYHLYKFKAWKKEGGKIAMGGQVASEFNRLKGGEETKTPRMGGVVIWGSTFITISVLYLLTLASDNTFFNDFFDIEHGGKGVRLSVRLALITLLSAFIGWWFYAKLGVDSIGIPFGEPLYVGALLIPFFILLTNALYASGVIDGIDGLSGGVFATIFSAYC